MAYESHSHPKHSNLPTDVNLIDVDRWNQLTDNTFKTTINLMEFYLLKLKQSYLYQILFLFCGNQPSTNKRKQIANEIYFWRWTKWKHCYIQFEMWLI